MVMGNYLIEPREKLVQAIKVYNDDYLKNPIIWNINEHPHHRQQEFEQILIPQIKLVFLAKLFRSLKYTVSRHDRLAIIETLFGRPPEFSIRMFNRWWTIRRIPNSRSWPHEFLSLSAEDLKALEESGDESDKLLETSIKLKEIYEGMKDGEEKERLKNSILSGF